MAIQDGLRAYWKLDEASGTRFDLQGIHDLTPNGTVTAVAGKVGNAAQFPVPVVQNTYLRTPNHADFNPGQGDFTVAGWLHVQQNTGTNQTFIAKGSITQFNRQYIISVNSSLRLEILVSGNGAAFSIFGNTLPLTLTLNTWHFVVIWHDGTNDQIGIQIDNNVPQLFSYAAGIFNGTAELRLGSHGFGLWGFAGRMDEWGFWGRVLTTQERSFLYNGGAGRTLPRIVAQAIASDVEIVPNIRVKHFPSRLGLVKQASSDKAGSMKSTQPLPIAPTLLTATDLKTGDSIRLVWAGGGPRFNVFFKVSGAGTFTKANANPLPGSQTQYDVGGLSQGVSHTFMVRGVTGLGVESPDSNQLSATPTLDVSLSKFASPAWTVRVSGADRTDAVLHSVELGYGADVSNAVFVIHKDPDEGGFPNYDDSVEIIVNGRRILRGRIKGITSRISTAGLTKTFTVVSNVTKFQEKVVPIGKDTWNVERDEEGNIFPKRNAPDILRELLGFVPEGVPNEFPGQVHLTDQTLLDAAETVIRKLGNYKLFFNQDNEQLEVYRFGQGGDATRQFIKGQNLLESSITENRQDVVDRLTLIGPPRQIRVERILGFPTELPLVADASGALRRAFTLTEPNARDIQVLGTQKGEPSLTFDDQVEVIPEDFDNLLTGEWPVPLIFFGGFVELSADGDAGMKRAIRTRGFTFPFVAPINASIEYKDKTHVTVFLSELPQVRDHIVHSGTVQNRKIGIIPLDGTTFVQTYLGTSVFFGGLKVRFTHDGERPRVSVGSGPIERTITDSQYQIIVNTVPGEAFSNEAEVLDLMTKRVQAEFERLSRPRISGTITVIGDETIDLKSTVIVNGQKLDVVKVIHNFTNGFTSQVALTNEPFVATVVSAIPREDRRRRSEQTASTEFRITVLQDVEIDKNVAALRQQELQKRLQLASTSHAVYQD